MNDHTKVPKPVVTVACLIYNSTNQILLLKESKWTDHFGLPAGKVHFGKTLAKAITREVKEETGLSLVNLRPVLLQEIIRPEEFITNAHFLSYAFKADTNDSQVTINDESCEYQWIDPLSALAKPLNTPTRELINFELTKKGCILITDLKIDCIVGIFPHERTNEQSVYVSATLEVNNGVPASSENVDDTIDYDTLSKKITEFAIEQKFQSIETMAEKISELILLDKRVHRVDVLIKKPDAVAEAAYMGVQISRSQHGV